MATTTREIPRREWTAFFDHVSRMHVEQGVSVEVLRNDIGAQLEVTSMPFDGITADLKHGESSIAIAAGSATDGHITHIINDPIHVRVLIGADGDEEALEIEAADDSTTLVFFADPGGWCPSRVIG